MTLTPVELLEPPSVPSPPPGEGEEGEKREIDDDAIADGWLSSCLGGSLLSGRGSDAAKAQEPGCVSPPMSPCLVLVVVSASHPAFQKVCLVTSILQEGTPLCRSRESGSCGRTSSYVRGSGGRVALGDEVDVRVLAGLEREGG